MEVDKNTNQPIAVYYHGLGLLCRYTVATGQYSYYHYDLRGSTTNITDAFQNVTHSYRYGTFGDVTNQTQQFEQPFKYVGKYGVQYDARNLYYMRNRCYNPYYGRFYSEDPVWSTNLFPYADNNPITNIDPSGKYIETAIDVASFAYDLNEYRKNPSLGNLGYLALDGITTLLPIVAGGGVAARTAINGVKYTKSSLKVGQDIHRLYKFEEILKGIRIKEFRLPSGLRIDFIDFEKKIIYELKPNNPRQIKEGTKQLQIYLKEVEKLYGKGWKTVLDLY